MYIISKKNFDSLKTMTKSWPSPEIIGDKWKQVKEFIGNKPNGWLLLKYFKTNKQNIISVRCKEITYA